jgi:hypothetical protein
MSCIDRYHGGERDDDEKRGKQAHSDEGTDLLRCLTTA